MISDIVVTNDDCRVKGCIKKYLRDINVKHKLLNNRLIHCSDNQQSYYEELTIVISNYFKSHILLFNYISDKLNVDDISLYLGYSVRHTQRYLQKQVQLFIDFVTMKEDEALAKYNFNDEIKVNDEIQFEE